MNGYSNKQRMKITVVFMILILIANIIFVYNVVKADETGGTVYIKANYSSSITPQSGDKFIITYKRTDGEQTATIELDASTISEQYAPMNLPVASYIITKIEYKGSNTEITNSGYGIVADFLSRSQDEDILYLAIGKEQTSILEREYANVIVMDSNHDANGKIIDIDETVVTETMSSEYTSVIYETTSSSEIEATIVEEQSSVNEEPSVEEYNKGKKNNSTGILVRIIPVTLLFAIAFIVVVVLHKKGKI